MNPLEKVKPENRKAYLIPYPIESFARPISIESGRTLIGRSPGEDIQIQINDRRISRQHACIHAQDSRFFIEDLNSQNGTYLNKSRVTKAPLNSHDRISIGNRSYLFLLQPPTDSASSSETPSDASATIALSHEEMDLSDIWAQNAENAAHGFLHQDADPRFDTAQPDALAHQRLSLLYQLSESLSTAGRTSEVYQKGIELIMEAIPEAEFTLVAKKSVSEDAFTIRSIQLRDPQQAEGNPIPVSQTVFEWVLKEKVTLVSQNLGADQRFQDSESIRIHDLRAIVCVPIVGKKDVLGLLYAQSNNLLSPFTQDDAKFVSAVAREMALNIDNIHLQRNMLSNARMAAIGLTVSNLAHNIKNLLAVNQVAIQLMDSHIKEKDYTHIEKKWRWIKDSLDGISKLSTDMLEYAREDELFFKSIDVNAVIRANRPRLEESQSREGLTFEYALAPEDPHWPLDEEQLKQALLNLVLNAADALKEKPRGRILISTAVRHDQHLLISVADDGCGIPDKNQRKVLDLFFTTKGSKGTGLGLPMVHKFVEKSGGRLNFQSEEGQGSVFKMIFPQRNF